MKLIYFAWLRERLELNDEEVVLPPELKTVDDLFSWLKTRNEQFAGVFEHSEIIQVAVNQQHIRDRSTTIEGAKEIAFFPPMTGG